MSRLISDLVPEMQPLAQQFLEKAAELGYTVLITETLRSYDEQNQLYAQGRTTPGHIVTNAKAGYSAHNFARAFDFVPMQDGKPWWNAPEEVWEALGSLGESLGLEWGGRWQSIVDKPHLQYMEGKTLAELRAEHDAGTGGVCV